MPERARYLVAIVFSAWFPFGCRSEAGRPATAEAKPEAARSASSGPPEASAASGRKQYGAPIRSTNEKPLSEVLANSGTLAGQTVVVEGEVRRACSRKGCWMEIAEGADKSQPGCRVTFRDYGFFVPTDSAGSKARVEAAVQSTRVEPSMVEHLESEGATFASREADGSARETRLVASGVELWR